MPKISDAHREQRRTQILEAAWRCFYRNGVQATTMEEIIAESGLSASAMYRYFKGKEDIILNAITASLNAFSARLGPLVADPSLDPPHFVERVLEAIETFAARRGFNLLPIAVHGWSEAQRNDAVREVMVAAYGGFRRMLAMRVRGWQAAGLVDDTLSAEDAAQTLQSLVLGYIVQVTITRDVSAAAHARAAAAAWRLPSAGSPA